jgi:NADH:ubiquinone oxidoreductase subunit 2 (subunit N)
VAIFLKVGGAPLHTWFPLVAHTARMKILWLLLTLQKLIPILFLIIIKTNLLILLGFIIFSATLGPVLNFSQNNIKFILVFSRISHIAWLIRGIYLSFQGWTIYFLVYLIICSFVLLDLIKFLNQNSLNPTNNFRQILLFLNFGGLPPLLGFFPKFFIVVLLLEKRNTIILLLLLISSVVDFFIYTRIFYSFMYTKSNKLIWKLLKKNSILEKLYLTIVFFGGFFILI